MSRLVALLTFEHETFCTHQLFQKASQEKKKISLVLNDVTSKMHSTKKRILLAFCLEQFCCLDFLQKGKEEENTTYRRYKLHKLNWYVSDFCFSFMRVLA